MRARVAVGPLLLWLLPAAALAQAPVGLEFVVGQGIDPQVTAQQSGFVALWRHDVDGVRARRFAATGAPVGNEFVVSGADAAALAWLELGHADTDDDVVLTRQAADEIFRIVATESTAERAANPGLPFEHASTIVATCCIVLAVMRRFELAQLRLVTRV